MTPVVPAVVELSFIEYQATFRDPIFEAWARPNILVASLFRSLRQSGLTLANISRERDRANLADVYFAFSLLESRLTFKVGLGGITASINNPNWSDQDQIAGLMTAAVDAVVSSTQAHITQQHVTMAMHVTPKGKSPKDVISRFVHFEASTENVLGFGFSVYRQEVQIVADYSWLYPGALFSRITRAFPGDATFGEMGTAMNHDEKELGSTLGLEIE